MKATWGTQPAHLRTYDWFEAHHSQPTRKRINTPSTAHRNEREPTKCGASRSVVNPCAGATSTSLPLHQNPLMTEI